MIFLVALLVAASGPWAEAQRLLKKDRPEEALVLLQAARAKEPRIAALADRIAAAEKVRSAEDWPEPAIDAEHTAELRKAQALFDKGDPRSALPVVERLCAAFPGWRAPRFLRARALEELGRVDEAARELGILVQIAPSQAQAWRKLGELLALHGGLLEAERADEALRQALAREPSWTDLWLLRARVALRRGRAQDAIRALDRVQQGGGADAAEVSRLLEAATALPEGSAPASVARAPEPTAQAREYVQKAQEALATEGGAETAKALLQRALDESVAFPEAAAAWLTIAGEVPQRAVDALWNDGTALLDLVAQVRKARPDLAGGLVRPWLDRAVDLGAPEARYQRALDRADADAPGALADLVAYAAQSPPPAHLEEAKALRARIVPAVRIEPAEVQALSRLVEDRPEAALVSLGGGCARTTTPPGPGPGSASQLPESEASPSSPSSSPGCGAAALPGRWHGGRACTPPWRAQSGACATTSSNIARASFPPLPNLPPGSRWPARCFFPRPPRRRLLAPTNGFARTRGRKVSYCGGSPANRSSARWFPTFSRRRGSCVAGARPRSLRASTAACARYTGPGWPRCSSRDPGPASMQARSPTGSTASRRRYAAAERAGPRLRSCSRAWRSCSRSSARRSPPSSPTCCATRRRPRRPEAASSCASARSATPPAGACTCSS